MFNCAIECKSVSGKYLIICKMNTNLKGKGVENF